MRTKNGARRISIVDSFHEPALRSQVLVDAIQRSLFFTFPATLRLNSLTQRPHLDVPFIACPLRFRPPIAFRSPRSGERQDSSARALDRKSTRLNSSHQIISYAVFCLKKKTTEQRSSNPCD